MMVAVLLPLLLSVSPEVGSSKILILPTAFNSHLFQAKDIAESLKMAGHNVTMLVPNFYEWETVKAGIDHLSYDGNIIPEMESDKYDKMLDNLDHPERGLPLDAAIDMEKMGSMFNTLCQLILSNQTLMREIEDSKFKLAVSGVTLFMRCLLTIPYKYDIPFVSFSILEYSWLAGITNSPSVALAAPIPGMPPSGLTSLIGRIHSLASYLVLYKVLPGMDGNVYIDEHVPDKPLVDLNYITSKAQMHFINVNIYCLDYPRMSAPNYHYITGITSKKEKPLVGDIAEFINGAEHGIILISFGSNKFASAIMSYVLPRVLKGLSRIEQRAIVHLQGATDSLDHPDNVKIVKWMPQNDILAHPGCKLFVSHGGANGQMEAVYHGVPLITIPHSSEQNYNAIRVQAHGYGEKLSLHHFTAEDLAETIEMIVNNDTYKKNMEKCSAITRSLPSGREVMTFWVNHILEFGGNHLRPLSADMPLYKTFMLDVLAVIMTIITTVVTTVSLACLLCLRAIRRKHPKSQGSKKQD